MVYFSNNFTSKIKSFRPHPGLDFVTIVRGSTTTTIVVYLVVPYWNRDPRFEMTYGDIGHSLLNWQKIILKCIILVCKMSFFLFLGTIYQSKTLCSVDPCYEICVKYQVFLYLNRFWGKFLRSNYYFPVYK